MGAVGRKANTTNETGGNPEFARRAISSAKLEQRRKACFEDSWFSEDHVGFANNHGHSEFENVKPLPKPNQPHFQKSEEEPTRGGLEQGLARNHSDIQA
jgi:hypothetical protein